MLNWTYNSPGPVASAFGRSKAFIAGIRGPVGSGKSTVCVMKLLANARNQRMLSDGWRRRRSLIFRNTYSELRLTTIPTFHQWIPDTVGDFVQSGPPRQHIIDTVNKFEWEIIFLALDRPKDVRKVLSLDLSDAWGNEAREFPKAIIDGVTGRLGRYPAVKDGGATDVQLILDTNSMDNDHWWYVLAEQDGSTQRNRDVLRSLEDAAAELRADGLLGADASLLEFFAQPGGRTPQAENKANLRPGYYTFTSAAKSREWIKVYVDNEYGFVQEGKPVYPDYVDSVHYDASVKAQPGLGLYIGLDFGLTPAAVFKQRAPNGRWFCVDELVAERLGATKFGKDLARKIRSEYPEYHLEAITGDPSGESSLPDDEDKTVFTILEGAGIYAKPAHTNESTVRREAVSELLTQMIDGRPAMVVGPKAPRYRKALAGGYAFKRLAVAGEERYQDKPDKNMHSHVAEAGQYCILGGGEGKKLMRPKSREQRDRPRYADA